MCELQNYLGLKLWLSVMGSSTWFIAKSIMRMMVGKIYWFLNLTICKNMLVGENVKSHTLDLLWANISCLLVFNVPRMNGCELVGIKVTLLKWWLFLVKLLRRNIISFNLLPYFGFWNFPIIDKFWEHEKTPWYV
jgi:hypothetical protein